MADVAKAAVLPPHLRALTVARTARAIKPPDVSTKDHEADINAPAAVASPLRQVQSISEDTESLFKTHGVKIDDTANAVSISPTSGAPSIHKKLDITRNASSTLQQATDGLNESKRGNHGLTKHGKRRGNANKGNRDSRWAHGKDIPKGNDGRWETDWACPDIYVPPSWKTDAGADATGGEPKDGKEHQLNGWDGGWAPAPLSWDSRPAFRPGQSANLIENWMAKSDEAIGDKDLDLTIPKKDLKLSDCDVASRLWVPVAFGKQPPQTFWGEMVRSQPFPIDEDDLDAAQPWWEKYESTNCSLLQAYRSPEFPLESNPDESVNERLARESDRGSAYHAENRIRFERAKREAVDAERRRIHAKEQRIKRILNNEACPTPLKPKIKLYIRSARLDDMEAIGTIYNLHVTQTISTAETQHVDVEQLTERFRDVQRQKLPFLVACECGETIKARRTHHKRRMEEDVVLPDHIVGFAFANMYGNLHDAFRYSVKVEIYTASNHFMKGVANCLMDKLLACLDPQYLENGGYEVKDPKLQTAEPERTVQSIMISIPYDEANSERMQWTSNWLKKRFRFDNVGDFCGVGVKHGKKISLYVLQRNTGVTIDLDNPPDVLDKLVEESKDNDGTNNDPAREAAL